MQVQFSFNPILLGILLTTSDGFGSRQQGFRVEGKQVEQGFQPPVCLSTLKNHQIWQKKIGIHGQLAFSSFLRMISITQFLGRGKYFYLSGNFGGGRVLGFSGFLEKF